MAAKDRTTLLDYLTANHKPVPAESECPVCGVMYPPFAIVSVSDIPTMGGDFACGNCIQDDVRARAVTSTPAITWADVRSYRTLLLDRSDWTQMLDVAESVRTAWAPTRAALRNVTESFNSPTAAYLELKKIEKERF